MTTNPWIHLWLASTLCSFFVWGWLAFHFRERSLVMESLLMGAFFGFLLRFHYIARFCIQVPCAVDSPQVYVLGAISSLSEMIGGWALLWFLTGARTMKPRMRVTNQQLVNVILFVLVLLSFAYSYRLRLDSDHDIEAIRRDHVIIRSLIDRHLGGNR